MRYPVLRFGVESNSDVVPYFNVEKKPPGLPGGGAGKQLDSLSPTVAHAE